MVDNHDDALCNSPDRLVLASSTSDAMVLGMEIGSGSTSNADGNLSHYGSQPDITFGGSSTESFAPALSVSRTYSGPRRQVLGSRETGHFGTNLSHNDRRSDRIERRNRLKQGHGFKKRGEATLHLLIDAFQSLHRGNRYGTRSARSGNGGAL